MKRYLEATSLICEKCKLSFKWDISKERYVEKKK